MEKKLPPQSRDAEMMVLGAMINSNSALNIACDLVDDTDFYYPEHKILFMAMRQLHNENKPIDTLILSEFLKNNNSLEAGGGIQHIMYLTNYATSSVYIEDHCEIIRNKSIFRKLIATAQDMEQTAILEREDANELLENTSRKLFNISQRTTRDKCHDVATMVTGENWIEQRPFMEWVQKKQAEYAEAEDKDNIIAGMRTHINGLDKVLNGMGNTHLLILAARPGVGKTALALNICSNIAIKDNLPVGIFSLEMSKHELFMRLVSTVAHVDSNKLKVGNISQFEFRKLQESMEKIKKAKIHIDDQGGIRINDLRARARRMVQHFGIRFLMVDYLQLIEGSGSRMSQESRQIQVSEISKELKNLAKELDIPVLCLSQLSRNSESREDKTPRMSDLRDSGSIEQDADAILMIHREDYYDATKNSGLAKVLVLKNRHGATGNVELTFDKEYFEFKDREKIDFNKKTNFSYFKQSYKED